MVQSLAAGLDSGSVAFDLDIRAARSQRRLAILPYKSSSLADGTVWLQQFRRTRDFLLRFPGYADFSVNSAATQVCCWPVPNVSQATLDHLFANQVLQLAISQRGTLVLHGSAVRLGQGVIGFLGESGRGKSTLAAHFATAGAPFLTDDGLFVDLSQPSVIVFPGHKSLRLWADSEAQFVGSGAERVGLAEFTQKGRLLANRKLRHSAEPCTLKCLYMLEKNDATRVTIGALPVAAAFIRLVTHSFLLDTGSPHAMKRHFCQLDDLLKRVPVFSLDYPRDYAQLDEVRARIVEHAASLP
jgi:hypothetical protein